jgi:group I intron endonuclease
MAYKSVPQDCGIYAISNTLGDHVYIGQSVCLRQRKRQHLSKLSAGKHYNDRMQKCFNKYGMAACEFTVLEYCNEAELTNREQYWIDQQDRKKLLNCAPVAMSPAGVKRSQETIEKRLAKMAGYKHSEETKAKMKASQLARCEIARQKALEQMQDPQNRFKAGSAHRGNPHPVGRAGPRQGHPDRHPAPCGR